MWRPASSSRSLSVRYTNCACMGSSPCNSGRVAWRYLRTSATVCRGNMCHMAAVASGLNVQVTKLTASATSRCKFVVPLSALASPPQEMYILGPAMSLHVRQAAQDWTRALTQIRSRLRILGVVCCEVDGSITGGCLPASGRYGTVEVLAKRAEDLIKMFLRRPVLAWRLLGRIRLAIHTP